MNISIPALHISDPSKVEGKGTVQLHSRKETTIAGTFTLAIRPAIAFPDVNGYPIGGFTLEVQLNDGARGKFSSTTIDLINSHGKVNPTVFLTGRCAAKELTGVKPQPKGLRYWLMIVGNAKPEMLKVNPDIVSFAIHDQAGALVAYGTGPVTPPSSFSVQA